jgi:hypothetical protein
MNIQALKQVFSEASKDNFPIIIHLRNRADFGAGQVNSFVNEILPSAGSIAVQIAHGGGWAASMIRRSRHSRPSQRPLPHIVQARND